MGSPHRVGGDRFLISAENLAPTRFNVLKHRTLAIFNRCGWLNPAAWAVLAGFHPARAAYSYLLHLHRSGLLLRRHNSRGLLLYGLSAQGSRRLLWLQEIQREEGIPACESGAPAGGCVLRERNLR